MISGIKNFFTNLDRKDFIRYAALYVGICVCIAIGLVSRHIYEIVEKKSKFLALNQARKSIQKSLTKYSLVEQQKKKVDELLVKDKNFYIKKFFDGVAQKNNVHQNSKETVSKQKLENGYIEEALSVTLSAINTKQLCELLQDIENEQRVYIKFVDINKMMNAKKINVTMSVATVIPDLK